mmetsp:Transcript_19186/g.24895  ORF Transcript_19186/g.24895 Transcript_19186/m.24895 type:complete len:208 (+) Transcript_19186:71-694(+)
MKFVLALCLFATGAHAFVAPQVSTQSATIVSATMSRSVPFLTQPKNLDGSMAGDVGFDPFGFAESFDIRYLREAEIKNGRVAMMAIAGIAFQELGLRGIFATGPEWQHGNPIKAAVSVPPYAWATLITLSGIVEYVSNNGKMTYMTMFEDDREPGAFGFDPLKFMTDSNAEEYKLKEITHCRAAMIAVGGIIHHSFVTGTGIFGATS